VTEEPRYYQVKPSKREGYTTVSCMVAMPWTKEDGVFSYQMYATGAVTQNLPDGATRKDTTIPMKGKEWNQAVEEPAKEPPKSAIEIQGILKHSDVKGTARVSAGYEIPEDVKAPNKIGFVFEYDADYGAKDSAATLQDDRYVNQFISYRKKRSRNEWKTIACITRVGKPGEAKVLNFSTKAEIVPADVQYMDYDRTGISNLKDDNAAEKKIKDFVSNREFSATDKANGEFFEKRAGDPAAYALTQYGSKANNKVQRCVAQIEFPKFTDDVEEVVSDDFFAEYEVKHGAIVSSAPTTGAVHTTAKAEKATLKFDAPNYSDDIKNKVEQFKAIQVRKFFEETTTFDSGKVLNADKTSEPDTGKITVKGEMITVPDPEADGLIRFTMQMQAPKKHYVKGDVYGQFLRLTNAQVKTQDPQKIMCGSTLGFEEKSAVVQYKKEYDVFDVANIAFFGKDKMVDPKEKLWRMAENPKLYRSKQTDTHFITSCAVEIVIDKGLKESAAEIFNMAYDIKYGVHKFPAAKDGFDSTASEGVATADFLGFLPMPQYKQKEEKNDILIEAYHESTVQKDSA